MKPPPQYPGLEHRPGSENHGRFVQTIRRLLRVGSASNPPVFDELFDKNFTISSFHFLSNPIERLKESRKLLKPGGLIGVTVQPRSRTATDATTAIMGEEIAANLECAGFSHCRLEIRKSTSVSVACALANK